MEYIVLHNLWYIEKRKTIIISIVKIISALAIAIALIPNTPTGVDTKPLLKINTYYNTDHRYRFVVSFTEIYSSTKIEVNG